MTIRRSFLNEYGRQITVAAERMYEARGPRPGWRVKLTISGPDSTDTNVITIREARMLQGAIGAVLSAGKGSNNA